MKPVEKGLLLGVLGGVVLALLTWQITWIAGGVFLGTTAGYIIRHRQRGQHKTVQDTKTGAPLTRPDAEERSARRMGLSHAGVDEELAAAMRTVRETWTDYRRARSRHSGEPVLSVDELLAAKFGHERGKELWAEIRALHAEAESVPDPGGPVIGEYADALRAWADTHPEVDPFELNLIVGRQMREHR